MLAVPHKAQSDRSGMEQFLPGSVWELSSFLGSVLP
jgi:hypothetical protein